METNGNSSAETTAHYAGQPYPSLSPALLNRLFTAAPGVLCQLWIKRDGRFGFDFISGRVKELFGITAQEMYDRPERMLEAIPPEDRAAMIQRMSSNDATQHAQTFVDRYIMPDGRLGWMRSTTFTEWVPAEEVIRFTTHTVDATAEVEMQNQARGVAQRMQAMLEASPDAIWILRAIEADDNVCDFEVTDFNFEAERLFGAARHWIVGRTIKELGEENPEFLCLDLYLSVFHSKLRHEGEVVVYKADAEPRRIRREITPLPFGLAVLAHDITKEWEDQIRLEESELKFREMAEHVDEAFWLNSIDPPQIIYMSPAFERITGISPIEVCKDPSVWRCAIHPDQVAHVVHEFEAWVRLEKDYDVTYQIRRTDGQWRWIRDIGSVVKNDEGEPYRLVGITRDITEETVAKDQLVASEEKYRRIVSTAHEGIAVLDYHGRVEFANQRMSEMLGRTNGEVCGRSLGKWIHPDQLIKAGPLLGEDLPSGVASIPIRFLRSDGTAIHVHASVSPLIDQNGQPNGRVVMAADITSLVQAEEKMRHLDQQLAHVAKISSMGATTAEIAHELNQPLYAMSNYADACINLVADQEGTLFETLRNHLGQVIKAAQRASGIVRRIGNFVRSTEPDRRSVDLNALIEETTDLVKMAGAPQDISFRFNLDRKLPNVLIDPLLIGQVIVNLLRNSVEALNEGKQRGKRVTISTKQVSDDQIRVAIEDNGPGVPADMRGSMFDAFVSSKETGTGLGLPICRTIVEAHDGRLWYEPRGSGAEFVFTLPYHGQDDVEK
jgi:two-component system sensor kinase FixL